MLEDDDSGEAESTADRQVVAAPDNELENDGPRPSYKQRPIIHQYMSGNTLNSSECIG